MRTDIAPRIDLDAITHVFLTGAGLSAESGLPTFRGAGGMWNNHRAEDLANYLTWKQNYDLVHAFYSMRRAKLVEVEPNAAHYAIAGLGNSALNLTQNVDNLLERAGCENVVHLHGRLWTMKCEACGRDWEIGTAPWREEDRCPSCHSRNGVKPGVVMFHEAAPNYSYLGLLARLEARHTLVIIGTSGAVLDINGLVGNSTAGIKVLNNAEQSSQIDDRLFDHLFYEPTTSAIPKILALTV